jgi:hypothetical protein
MCERRKPALFVRDLDPDLRPHDLHLQTRAGPKALEARPGQRLDRSGVHRLQRLANVA